MSTTLEQQFFKQGEQIQPGLVALSGERYLVCWNEIDRDTGRLAIKGQIVTSKGHELGDEFPIAISEKVNVYTDIVALPDGGFVVAFLQSDAIVASEKSYSTAHVAIFDEDGTLTSEHMLDPIAQGGVIVTSALSIKSDGTITISWVEEDPSTEEDTLYSQSYDADFAPLSSPVEIFATSDSINDLSLTLLADGSTQITWRSDYFWEDISGDDKAGIYTRSLGADGVSMGAIAEISHGTLEAADPVLLASGELLFVWAQRVGVEGWDILGTIFSPASSQVSQAFTINTSLASDQYLARATALEDGGFLVVWSSQGQDGDGSGIYAQTFGADGSKVGGEILVNSQTVGNQTNAEITAIDGTDYAIVWQSDGEGGGDIVLEVEKISNSEVNQTFHATAMSETIAGHAGIDVCVYAGSYQDVTLDVAQDGSVTVRGLATGTDHLTNIERVVFDDGTIAVDVGLGENAGEVYRLYKAAFARTPDEEGLSYWIEKMDAGISQPVVAEAFLYSDEFVALYGSASGNADYVANLYANILGREGDAEGIAFWTESLASGGTDKAHLLAAFAESAENVSAVAPIIEDGILI